jgi:hypothetical protein
MNTLPRNPDVRIIEVLAGLACRYNKAYSFPSQDKILELLKRHTGRLMSRRTLNRHLAALERDGWVRRLRRHRRGQSGALELHSTLYHMLRRTVAWVHKMGRAASTWLKTKAFPFPPSAVTSVAQHTTPSGEISSPGVIKPPPPGWKAMKEALRAANLKAKPL